MSHCSEYRSHRNDQASGPALNLIAEDSACRLRVRRPYNRPDESGRPYADRCPTYLIAGLVMRGLLERVFPYLRRNGRPSAWTSSPEASEIIEWARGANVEIVVEWRVSPGWLSSAPEYGPGWLAIIRPRDGGRNATAVRPTELEAIAAARRAYEVR
jgi:hypothetical protein